MTPDVTYKKLGEVGQVITGNTPSTKDARNYASNDVCFFKPSDFDASSITQLDKSEYYISNYAYEHARQLPKDSVLTTCIGIIGKVGILSHDATCNQQINAIIPNQDIVLPRYLGYALLSIKEFLTKTANAPVVPLLNKSQFSAVSIPIPSLDIQHSIVCELDAINAIIADKKQQLAELDTLAQAIFYNMFGAPITNDKGWEVKTIGEVATFYNGKAHEQDINEEGRYILVNSKFISSDASIFKRTDKQNMPLFKNDIIMVMSDVPNGRALAKCMLIDEDNKYTLNQRICAFRGYQEVPIYLLYILNRHPYYLAFDDGDSQTNLRKDDVLACPIPLPPLSLQQAFAAKIEAIEEQKSAVRASLTEFESLLAQRLEHHFA